MAKEYQAGKCNIGDIEISYRKRVVGYGSAIIGAALYVMLVFFNFPLSLYPIIFIPVFISVHGLNEAKNEFCTAYGRTGRYNMASELGSTQNVLSSDKRKKDRTYARKLTADSVKISLVISAVLIAASRLFN